MRLWVRGPLALGVFVALAIADPGGALAASGSDARLQQIEDQVRALKDDIHSLKSERAVDQARIADLQQDIEGAESFLDRVEFGGYGSIRFDASSLGDEENTFTFRRLVFTTSAQLAPRLRFYSEIEYERFRKIELERKAELVGTSSGGPGLLVEQEIEGTDASEIALEQAWLEWEFDSRLRLRTGGVLVPLGRFNLNHDDNQWNLPRRSLVDRGVAVLPAKAAWDELGAGFTGRFDLGEGGLSYQIYVVNGVVIQPEVEELLVTRAGKRDKLELEAEFVPQTGTFSKDSKGAKALTGRLAWQPAPGHEIAASFYRGRYTPDFLSDQSVTSLAIDGLTHIGNLEIEGEAVTTHWDGVKQVARSFANRALRKEANNPSAFDPNLESEIEFELDGLARRLTGFWVELRYPFWPSFLPRGEFANPLLVPTARIEQVWFKDQLTALDFSNGVITEFESQDRQLGRATLGLAFRPTPLIVFTAAYEYIRAANNKSLAGLTNFLSARSDEERAHAFLMGVAFGF